MNTYINAGDPADIAHGRELIASGKVGCIVLAGGDGSRLGWDGPKGTYPLSLVKQKTLFQLLAEHLDAAKQHYNHNLNMAVMTSPLNYDVTRKALPNHIDLFLQSMAPLLDLEHQELEEKRPNGNGEVLKCFYQSGLYDKWKASGVEYLKVIFIDNPLAEPFDPNQVGVHSKKQAEITLKAILKKDPDEQVGVIGTKEGKHCIVEYSENPPKEWNLANTGLFSFSMDFVEKIKDHALPNHIVKKFLHSKPVLKQETFLFDLLKTAEKSEVILYPREATFAPLKTREDVGPTQRALLNRDRNVFFSITGNEPEDAIFELDAAFHYPTRELMEKWKNAILPKISYIEP